MKAHTKFSKLYYYAFRAGASPRIYAFAIIFIMNLAFIIPGMMGVLPLAAQITAVSLSGTAIGAMAIFNIIGDASIIRHMFTAPGAVFYALTPAPRRKTLLASITAMFTADLITMIFPIISVIILSINLGSNYSGMNAWDMLTTYGAPDSGTAVMILISIALITAAYLFILMLIMFCKAMRKSYFYNKPAGGFLAFLTGVAVVYIMTLSPLLVAPFGEISRYYWFFTVTVDRLGMGLYALVIFILSAILYLLTSKLFERKINL